jgi:hypothetical protein
MHSPARPVVEVNPNFVQQYKEIKMLADVALAAAGQEDLDTLHVVHHKMIAAAINLAQFSFFGLSVKRINDQVQASKKPEEDQQTPIEHHPV